MIGSNPDDPGASGAVGHLRGAGTGRADADLTAVTYQHLRKANKVVGRLHRLRPLLGCRYREFHAVLPLLLHLEALVYRGDLAYQAQEHMRDLVDWRLGMELVLAAHHLDGPATTRHVELLEEYFTREQQVLCGAELDEDELRVLAHQRCSDVRLLVQVWCDSVGDISADTVLHVLDPLLSLREIRDDLRSCAADHAAGTFNLRAEYVRLFGESRGPARLHQEQQRLIGVLLRRWATLPRRRAIAFWPVVFDFPSPWRARLLRVLPKFLVLRWAQRALRAPGPSDEDTAGASAR